MPVLINYKICDNSKDCGGIEACSIGAFYWDEKKKKITVDNEKCTTCGKCEESCPVDAIRVAKTEKEYKKIKKEIEKDKRKISDLFVDRYGAEPVSSAFLIPLKNFKTQVLESTKVIAVELFSENSIKCLLYSIPVKELFKNKDINYGKIEVKENDSILKKYKVKNLPALLFFNGGKMVGKIEGYYDFKEKKKLLEKIGKIKI